MRYTLGAAAPQNKDYLDEKGTPPLDPSDLLTPEQLAARLQVPKSWVYEQTKRRATVRNENPMPCIRLGKYLRFSWIEVSNWLRSK